MDNITVEMRVVIDVICNKCGVDLKTYRLGASDEEHQLLKVDPCNCTKPSLSPRA